MRVEFGLSFMFTADCFPRTQILEITFGEGDETEVLGTQQQIIITTKGRQSTLFVVTFKICIFRETRTTRTLRRRRFPRRQKNFKKICESLTRTENMYACVDTNIILGECMYVLYGRRPRCFCEFHHVTETTDLEKLNV